MPRLDLDELEHEIRSSQTMFVWADVVLDLINELRECRKREQHEIEYENAKFEDRE